MQLYKNGGFAVSRLDTFQKWLIRTHCGFPGFYIAIIFIDIMCTCVSTTGQQSYHHPSNREVVLLENEKKCYHCPQEK